MNRVREQFFSRARFRLDEDIKLRLRGLHGEQFYLCDRFTVAGDVLKCVFCFVCQ
ncbi:hypothetical protein SDC9_137324 [bioreactor metagenome]|uniref:Uncharacterized protein n=1 Tax=bioreactor metagenome TaxID=1076179 RepID=A0A645DLP4_9ZZZZ